MNRIIIFGRPGSGKSTFAKKLSLHLGLPLYHLDKYFFTNNWAERDYDEFIAIQSEIVKSKKWIIDGNSLKSLSLRWPRADLIIYFNYPKLLCFIRLFKRLLKPDHSIDDRAPGCKEIIRLRLIKYLFSFEKRVLPDITSLTQKYPDKQFFTIRNNQELKKLWLYIKTLG